MKVVYFGQALYPAEDEVLDKQSLTSQNWLSEYAGLSPGWWKAAASNVKGFAHGIGLNHGHTKDLLQAGHHTRG